MKKLLTFLFSVIFAFGIVIEIKAQVNYFQGWEDAGAGLAGWTNTGTGGTFARNTSFPCTGLASVRANIYVAGNVRNFVSPLLGTSNGGLTTITFDYKVVLYGSPGTTGAPCGDFTIGVEWATSLVGTWNNIGLIDCSNHVVSASCAAGPGTYQFTPNDNDNVYIRFVITRLAGDNYFYFDNVTVQEAVPPCSGTPDPGNTISSTNPACPGVNFTLSLENATPGSGVEYLWQSSPDGNDPWADLGTSATQVISQTAATWYRSNVTCTNSNESGTSIPVYVTMASFHNCYCASYATNTGDTKIDNVTLNTLSQNSNPSNCETYTDYTSTATITELIKGDSYTMSVTQGTCGGSYGSYIKVYIDFDQNGVFDEVAEVVFSAASAGVGNLTTQNINIPAGATLGQTGMRVVLREFGSAATTQACGTYGYGETEDYLVEIIEGSTDVLSWYNLQWPPSPNISVYDNVTIYAQCWEPGVTNLPGPGAGIECWIGYNTVDASDVTDFASGWTWVLAIYNLNVGDNDEYMADLGVDQSLGEGTYYYVSRFRYNNGPFTYGGYNGGAWDGVNNVSGVLTVFCPAITTYPFFESFETSWPPACWTNLNWDDSKYGGPRTGTKWAYSNTNGSQLTTGEFEIPGTGVYLFSFWYRAESASYPQDFEVFLSTDGIDFTTSIFKATGITNITYQEVVYSLDAYTNSSVWFRFVGQYGTGGAAYGVCIDDVEVYIAPACPAPTALNATDITSSSATLNWTSAETLFNVKYNEGADFMPDSEGTAVTPDPTTNSAPISGLTTATTVYWYVRADCGTKAVSAWAGPHSFSTLLANDLCVDAIDLFCDDIVNGSTAGSTFDNVGDCGTSNTSGGVWYKFAGIGETVIASLDGSAYDTKLSIFEGDCNNLVCVWGNDDFPGIGTRSRVDWYSQSGVDYYILVHGFSSSTGSFTLTLTCSPALTSTWAGSYSPYRWTDARNWDNGVPGTTTDALIPAGLTNYPTVLRVNMCDDIFLGSNASRTATLLDNGFLAVNGTATVERYYGAPTWHLISSPIADGESGMYTGMYLQEYVETTNSWNDIVAVDDPLTPVKGFALWVDAPYTAVYQGDLNTGNQFNIFSEAGTDPFHWQLFGNPYPSGLDWNLVVPANLGLMSGAVYYLDAITGNYLSYNGGMGGGSQFVPPMQGFFISGLPACGGAPFSLDNTMRTHSGNNIYYKSEFSNMLVLTAEGNDLSDKTYIRFEEEATEQFDHQYDAYKLFSWANPILPQLYTIGEFNQSINVLPETNAILAGFRSGVDGTFTISIDEMNGMSHVILEDLFTGELTNLLEGNHIFNYNTSDIDERFIIHFAPLSVGDNAARNVNIWSYGNEVIVMVPELTNGQVKVYNMMGQEVVSSSVTSGRNVITVPQPGNYVVTLISNEVVRTEKVVIK
jgi:hypothetical protein